MTGSVDGIAFDATIVAPPRGPGTLVVMPEEAATIFGTPARVPVRATFNGISYRGSAMPMGDGRFGLGLTSAIRTAAGLDIGDMVHVVVERDAEERTIEVPDDLAVALGAAGLDGRFAALAFGHRREYIRWITDAKRESTRADRVAKAVVVVGEGRATS